MHAAYSASSGRALSFAAALAVGATFSLLSMIFPEAVKATVSPLYAYVTGGPQANASCPQTADVTVRCNLPQALAAVQAGGTVLLADQGIYAGEFHLATTGTSAGEPVTIEPAPEVTNPQLSGNFVNTVLTVDAGVFASLRGLTVANGAGDFSTYDCGVNAFFTLGGGINNAGTLTIDQTSILNNAGANFNGPADVGVGGGIYNSGTVRLDNSTLSGNTATLARVAGFGGAIYNAGTLSVSGTTFTGNLAQNGGGAIDNGDQIVSCDFPSTPGTGNVAISGSTFTGNRARTGGAIENTSSQPGSGTLTVDRSNFSDNGADMTSPDSELRFSTRSGGAIENINGSATISRSDFSANNALAGAAIDDAANGSGALSISATTFAGNGIGAKGNAAQAGGAIDVGSPRTGKLDVNDSTFVSNAATITGSAVDETDPNLISVVTSATFRGNPDAIASAGPLSLSASLLAGGGCATAIVDAGYNLSDDLSCGFTTAQHSVSGASSLSADLGAFGAHGGPTRTLPISVAADDPANDAIPATFQADGSAVCSGSDQRGQQRVNPCDIGAYEAPPAGRSFYAYAIGKATNPLSCPQTNVLALRCSFQSAIGIAAAGDFVELATPGSETDQSSWYIGSFELSPVGGSTPALPLTIRAAAGVADPIFDGNDGQSAGCQTKICSNAVLSIDPGSYVDFENFTIQDGGAGNGSLFQGATGCAISNDGSNVTVLGMTFYATGTACASVIGGPGVLTVNASRFLRGNRSIAPTVDVEGSEVVTISGSEFADQPQGYAVIAVRLTIYDSAINGGVFADTLTAVNTTFTGSVGHAAAEIVTSGVITNSTFADNSGGALAPAGVDHLAADLFAGSAGGSPNCDATPVDAGYNISDDGSCGFSAVGSLNNSSCTRRIPFCSR